MILRPLGLLAALWISFAPPAAWAEKAIPYLSSPVIDEKNLLSAQERSDLESFIRAQAGVVQAQVWITSLEGEAVESLAYRAGSAWKLGDEKKDNGLLVLVAPTERRMFILTGRGIQGELPDILAGRIVRNVMAPNFREGRYYQGIREALSQSVTLVNGGKPAQEIKEALGEESNLRSRGLSPFIAIIFFLIFISSIFGGFRRRRRSGFFFGSGYVGSGGFGSFGGGGGGGGWSGGGGSFDGGGAGGSW